MIPEDPNQETKLGLRGFFARDGTSFQRERRHRVTKALTTEQREDDEGEWIDETEVEIETKSVREQDDLASDDPNSRWIPIQRRQRDGIARRMGRGRKSCKSRLSRHFHISRLTGCEDGGRQRCDHLSESDREDLRNEDHKEDVSGSRRIGWESHEVVEGHPESDRAEKTVRHFREHLTGGEDDGGVHFGGSLSVENSTGHDELRFDLSQDLREKKCEWSEEGFSIKRRLTKAGRTVTKKMANTRYCSEVKELSNCKKVKPVITAMEMCENSRVH